MTRYAQGFYEQADGLSPAPRLRVAVGFGPGRVVGLTALVDTGSDVCAFPEEAFRGFALEKPPSYFLVRPFDGNPHAAPAYYPAVTAGDIRERHIAAVLRPGIEPLVGRSFLNRCRLELDAASGLVRIEARDRAGIGEPSPRRVL